MSNPSPINSYGQGRQALVEVMFVLTKEVLRYPKPLFIGCGLVFFQQVTGQPSVLYSATNIFKAAELVPQGLTGIHGKFQEKGVSEDLAQCGLGFACGAMAPLLTGSELINSLGNGACLVSATEAFAEGEKMQQQDAAKGFQQCAHDKLHNQILLAVKEKRSTSKTKTCIHSQSAGFAGAAAISSVLVGLVKLLATGFTASRVDQYGRRQLLLWGIVGMIVALALLGTAFSFRHVAADGEALRLGRWVGWLRLVK
eukprot:Skav224520  [mRNA]  locus=scaffold388:203763:212296:+ [translate_table: standard]